MFIEVMWYLHDNKGLETNNMHFKTQAALSANKAKQALLITFFTLYCFYDVNLAIG